MTVRKGSVTADGRMYAVVTPATARVGDRARIDEKEAVWCELEKHGAYLKEKHGDGTLAKFVAAVRAYKKAQEEITEPLRRILVKTRAPKVFGSAPTVPRRHWFVGCETDPARARAARNDTDMHRYCRTVVLHDLNWNPAMLEQRVGRLDRVDALAEKRNPPAPVEVFVPYLAESYDEAQFRRVLSRAEMQEAFFGPNDAVFEDDIETEERAKKKKTTENGREEGVASDDTPTPPLLGNLVYGYFEMDLSIEAERT